MLTGERLRQVAVHIGDDRGPILHVKPITRSRRRLRESSLPDDTVTAGTDG